VTTLLVMAKAPVAGQAKTRLAPEFEDRQAALFAAAALLDTLAAVLATPAHHRVVALDGDLGFAERAEELRALLAQFQVLGQRGRGFGQRLASAHQDTAALTGGPVLQIGMDTPQVTPELLATAAAGIGAENAVLGPAEDGGWWALGLPSASAAAGLCQVPMSRPDTGTATASMLRAAGLVVRMAPPLRDVDTPGDIAAVAALCPPNSHFRRSAHAAHVLTSGC
jgi:glycosyltransferase A (GT-A) superfamily protein (DUF2064 family)